jgi:hypothetical protein
LADRGTKFFKRKADIVRKLDLMVMDLRIGTFDVDEVRGIA